VPGPAAGARTTHTMKSIYTPEYRFMLARLRQARRDAGLTQAEVGRRLGLRQNHVSRMETGERRIDPTELAAFARLYGKPLAYFLDLPLDPTFPAE
jgi:transcriptional regulator with XRE-family HTH domain